MFWPRTQGLGWTAVRSLWPLGPEGRGSGDLELQSLGRWAAASPAGQGATRRTVGLACASLVGSGPEGVFSILSCSALPLETFAGRTREPGGGGLPAPIGGGALTQISLPEPFPSAHRGPAPSTPQSPIGEEVLAGQSLGKWSGWSESAQEREGGRDKGTHLAESPGGLACTSGEEHELLEAEGEEGKEAVAEAAVAEAAAA